MNKIRIFLHSDRNQRPDQWEAYFLWGSVLRNLDIGENPGHRLFSEILRKKQSPVSQWVSVWVWVYVWVYVTYLFWVRDVINPCVEPGSADNESEMPDGEREGFGKLRYETYYTRKA